MPTGNSAARKGSAYPAQMAYPFQEWAILPRQMVHDTSLSWAARGLLAFVHTLHPSTQLSEEFLLGQSPLGRDGLRTLIRELEQAGYLRRTFSRDQRGRASGSAWHAFDQPTNEQVQA